MMEELSKPVPWYHSVLDFVFPPLCLGCGAYVESGDPVCVACDDAIDTFSSAICLSCGQNTMTGTSCPVCGDDSFSLYAFADYVDPSYQENFEAFMGSFATFFVLALDAFFAAAHIAFFAFVS